MQISSALNLLSFSHCLRNPRINTPPSVHIAQDGTVSIPAEDIPLSSLLSPEAKAYVTQHLKDMQDLLCSPKRTASHASCSRTSRR